MFPDSDNSLDAHLRDVPVPPDLAARIIASLSPTDEQLDATLRAVIVPETLTTHLFDIPADLELEHSLANVPVPFTVVSLARQRTFGQKLQRVARQVGRLALAALWFVTLSLALAGTTGSLLQSIFPRPESDPIDLVMMYGGPLSVSAELGDSTSEMPVFIQALPLAEGTAGADPQFASTTTALLTPPPVRQPDWNDPPPAGPVTQWTSLVASGLRPLDDVVLLRYGLLGSPHYADDRLPDLEAPRFPRAAGIQPPLVRGYDRAFFLKHRVFPPLSPAAHPQLAKLEVPLVTESDVLARLEQALAEGRRPPASDLRVEDFLAAMNYRFSPAPAGKLALRTAAGPAPFGPGGAGLLQVGVQAGGLATRSQPTTHLVIALDLSQSMARGGKLPMVQEGLNRLLDQLGPRDRLSLVVFQEEIIHRVELATRDDVAGLRQLVASLSPRGGTNLAAGLQQGAALAMADDLPAGSARRLVLITDSPAEMPAETLNRVRQMLIGSREAGVRLDVLDLADRDSVDPILTDLALNLGGDIRPTRSPRQLAWSLVEALSGDSPVIASDAKLTLQFNPKAVAAYRLMGHEANAIAELTPAAVEAELAAGEAASALVELWFQPADVDDIGQAILTYSEPSGQSRRVTQRISRLQFAPTFGESAVSLQQAALAAEVGEQLRGSPAVLREIGLVSGSRGWNGILDAARQVHPQLKQRGEFQRLLAVVRTLNKTGGK